MKSDYVIIVKTHYFNNPNGLLENNECCDFNETRSDGECAVSGCDNYFLYYLDTRQVTQYQDSRISETNYNDAPINFSSPTVLGLPNPLPLPGLTKLWLTGVS